VTDDIYRIVVVDDLRNPMASTSEGIVVETHRTPEEGLAALQAYHEAGEKIEELWLDHDMGFSDDGCDLTIWPVVDWLFEQAYQGNPLDVTYVFVHTSNPWGRTRIKAALEKHYKVLVSELPLAEKND
jgi:hypothetical protein